MPQVPLPHILTEPKFSNNHLLRFVTTKDMLEGELLFEHAGVQENMKTREFEPNYHVFIVKQIYEARKARGDWSAWEQWPNYYACEGEYMGLIFKSDLHEAIQTQ